MLALLKLRVQRHWSPVTIFTARLAVGCILIKPSVSFPHILVIPYASCIVHRYTLPCHPPCRFAALRSSCITVADLRFPEGCSKVVKLGRTVRLIYGHHAAFCSTNCPKPYIGLAKGGLLCTPGSPRPSTSATDYYV